MARRTWKKGNLYISYGRPSIQAHHDTVPVGSMKDVMYFYYDLSIMQGNKPLLEMSTYDFPKVQNLHLYIDEIMNMDMEKAYLLEDYERDGFIRKVRYAQNILGDSFGFDIEYFYKIERYDYEVKQRDKTVPKKWTEYVLTIGNMEVSKEYGGDNREDYGKCIMIKNIKPEELVRLKEISNMFCEEAIRDYNKFTYPMVKRYAEECED